MAYIEAPIDTDYDELLRDALQRIQEQFPGWQPSNGHLEVALLQEMVRVARQTAVVAAQVPDRIFERYGAEVFDIEPIEAERATVDVEFTMIDDDGYAIPTGTVVAWDDGAGELVSFRTVEGLAINQGDTQGVVEAEAVEEGAQANDLGPGSAVLVDALRGVMSVAFTSESAGGVDAEAADEYRDRLADELRLQAPRAILPDDFAVLARGADGVHRALAIDGYDPNDESDGNERMVTVALVDEDGKPVTATAATAAQDRLDAQREVNFVAHIVEPEYTAVDVAVTVVAEEGRDKEALEGRVEDAVAAFLSPATWSGGDRSPPEWRGNDVVRRNELIAYIGAVDGVAYVDSLTLNGSPDDVDLDGVAPLPSPFDDASGQPWDAPSAVSATVD